MAVVVVLAALLGGGCGRERASVPGGDVVTLVPSPASRYGTITATGPGGTVELTGDLRDAAVPVTAARAFARPQSLVEYGLDQPQGTLQYIPAAGGERIDLAIGGPTFDARGIYLSRAGEERVYLVFVDRLRPVLAAAGIALAEPSIREPPAS